VNYPRNVSGTLNSRNYICCSVCLSLLSFLIASDISHSTTEIIEEIQVSTTVAWKRNRHQAAIANFIRLATDRQSVRQRVTNRNYAKQVYGTQSMKVLQLVTCSGYTHDIGSFVRQISADICTGMSRLASLPRMIHCSHTEHCRTETLLYIHKTPLFVVRRYKIHNSLLRPCRTLRDAIRNVHYHFYCFSRAPRQALRVHCRTFLAARLQH